MLKNINIFLAIIVMGLSIYSLLFPDHDSLLLPITQFTMVLLTLSLGLSVLKENNKAIGILCFIAAGFSFLVLISKSIFS